MSEEQNDLSKLVELAEKEATKEYDKIGEEFDKLDNMLRDTSRRVGFIIAEIQKKDRNADKYTEVATLHYLCDIVTNNNAVFRAKDILREIAHDKKNVARNNVRDAFRRSKA